MSATPTQPNVVEPAGSEAGSEPRSLLCSGDLDDLRRAADRLDAEARTWCEGFAANGGRGWVWDGAYPEIEVRVQKLENSARFLRQIRAKILKRLPTATGIGCQPEQAISCAALEGMESRGQNNKPSAAPAGETGSIEAPAGPPGPVGIQSPNTKPSGGGTNP